MAHIRTKVGRLFVEEVGQGLALLLWPSLLCDSSMWRFQVEDLQHDHRLLLIDPPGHGQSEPPPNPFTLEDCTEASLQVLDAHGMEQAVFVGLSWGGMVAMQAALHAPHRVRALVLCDTSAEPDTSFNRFKNSLMAAIFRRYGILKMLQKPVLQVMFSRSTLKDHPEYGAGLIEKLKGWDREGIYQSIRAVVLERRSILGQLPRINVPTLVLVGAADQATVPVFSERIVQAIPGARLERIPNAGHLSALESPEVVNPLIRQFLEQVCPQPLDTMI